MRSSRLWTRKNALWVRIGSREKAEPWWAFRTRWKSRGVKMRLVTRSSRRFGMYRFSRYSRIRSR
jgi:hypothetical protein